MSHVRRAGQTGPGEHLLLPRSVLDVVRRADRFAAWSGLSPDDLLVSPLCAVPLPVPGPGPVAALARPGAGSLAGRRPGRRPRLRAEAMWHPLLWLPRRMTRPLALTDPTTGRRHGETYDEWTVRTVLELCDGAPVPLGGRSWVPLYDHAGRDFVRPAVPADAALVPLYDVATGTWLDVLATVGIDVDDAADLARVDAWLGGGADPVLDTLDLEVHLAADGRSPHWAVHRAHRPLDDGGGTATTYVEDVRAASTALVCRELAGRAAGLSEQPSMAPREIARSLTAVASLAGPMTSLPRREGAALATRLAQLRAEAAAVRDHVDARAVAMRLSRHLGDLASARAGAPERLAARAAVERAEILAQVERELSPRRARPGRSRRPGSQAGRGRVRRACRAGG